MTFSKGYNQYKKVNINTSSPTKLVVMLYDGSIKFLEESIESLRKKDIEAAHRNIVKTQEIIHELISSLNYDAGDIANKLNSIYTYMNRRLLEANVKKEEAPIQEVINYLKELRTSWEHVATDSSPSNNSKPNNSNRLNNGSSLNISG